MKTWRPNLSCEVSHTICKGKVQGNPVWSRLSRLIQKDEIDVSAYQDPFPNHSEDALDPFKKSVKEVNFGTLNIIDEQELILLEPSGWASFSPGCDWQHFYAWSKGKIAQDAMEYAPVQVVHANSIPIHYGKEWKTEEYAVRLCYVEEFLKELNLYVSIMTDVLSKKDSRRFHKVLDDAWQHRWSPPPVWALINPPFRPLQEVTMKFLGGSCR